LPVYSEWTREAGDAERESGAAQAMCLGLRTARIS
jgi:hypothetical protein